MLEPMRVPFGPSTPLFLLPLLAWAGIATVAVPDGSSAVATITKAEVEEHVNYLASPTLEGRDSPSAGLMLAAEYVAGVFRAAGLVPAADSLPVWEQNGAGLPGQWVDPPAWSLPEGDAFQGTYLRPFKVSSMVSVRDGLWRPQPEKCSLELHVGDGGDGDDGDDEGEVRKFTYGTDFIPLARFPGEVSGELAWGGFGIRSKSQRYDDLKGRSARGKVLLILEGEPRHKRAFEGPDVTAESAIWNKIDKLEKAGAAGIIVVRRLPPKVGLDQPALPPLGFRYTYASFNPPARDRWRGEGVPVIEVTLECASALLGQDVQALAQRLDKNAKPVKVKVSGRRVSFVSACEEGELTLPNVVGILPGSDPDLRDEYVVVGAHMDHIGVGKRGRVGLGADDNASGTAAMLEVVEAMAEARPRRSILFAAFSGEEDGLLGSKHLASNLPVPQAQVVAMVNLDMVGRGETQEVFVLGFKQNPGMKRLVNKANELGRTGVRKIKPCNDQGLFARSDHYSFHQVGIPVVSFFENYPLEQNHDYHTWRDSADLVDMQKITNTARLAFHTAWLLADDDDRLPAPGR